MRILGPRRPRPPGEPPLLLVALTDPQGFVLLKGQLAAAHRAGFDVLTLSSPGELARRVSSDESAAHVAVPMERRIAPLRDLVALWRIAGIVRRHRPDVIDASTPKAGLLVALAAWALRVPVRVHTLRGLRFETMTGTGRALVVLMTRLTCRLSHRVVCISDSLRRQAVGAGVVDPDRAVVLGAGSSNGLDVERFSPSAARVASGAALRDAFGIPQAACVIGYVGRIARDKGAADLAEAWQSLRDDHPDLHWIVVGREDPTDPVPAATLAAMASDPRCHRAGQLDDVASAYLAFDVLVLPTYREGFGNVLIEAAAMGLPTVATSVTGCLDAVDDGVTGTLVAAGDPMALAEAVGAYVLDPELRRRHGTAGGERARRLYGQHEHWGRLHRQYCELLEAARR